jgi:hypothetical protein
VVRRPSRSLTLAVAAQIKLPQWRQKSLFSSLGILTLVRELIFLAICTYLSLLSG